MCKCSQQTQGRWGGGKEVQRERERIVTVNLKCAQKSPTHSLLLMFFLLSPLDTLPAPLFLSVQAYDSKAGWYLNDDLKAVCGEPDDNLVFVLEKLRDKDGRWCLPLHAPVTCFKRRDELEKPVTEPALARAASRHATQPFHRRTTARKSTLL